MRKNIDEYEEYLDHEDVGVDINDPSMYDESSDFVDQYGDNEDIDEEDLASEADAYEAEIRETTFEGIIERYDRFIALDENAQEYKEAKDEYLTYFLEHIERYVRKIAAKYYNFEYEENVSRAMEAILNHLLGIKQNTKKDDEMVAVAKYNPHISKPTTFFNQIIRRSMIDSEKMSRYYMDIYNSIKNKCQTIGQLPESMSIQELVSLTGLAYITVKATMDYVSTESQAAPEDMQINGNFDTPEDIIIHNESTKEISEAFMKLSRLEQYIVRESCLGNRTSTSVAKDFRDEEVREYFNITRKTVDTQFVVAQKNKAIQKLQRYLSNSSIFKRRSAGNIDTVLESDIVQMSMEEQDIDEAFSEGILILDDFE